MKPAQYLVIRYIADPARNEALNVGILAWTDDEYRINVDRTAVRRVLRDNPRLAYDALDYVQPMLEGMLQEDHNFRPERARQLCETQSGFPLALTEPRYTTIQEGGANSLDMAVERLVKRIVHPPRRTFSRAAADPMAQFERSFRPWVKQKKITPNFQFAESKSGTPRAVSFFANSGANIALDVVNLVARKHETIVRDADAEAFKIEDILTRNTIRYVVYCTLSTDETLKTSNEAAQRILASAGAIVQTDIAMATNVIEEAVSAR